MEEGEDIPTIAELPSAKEVVAADRLVRFPVNWPKSLEGKRFDLALGADVAKMLGKTAQNSDVQVITWKGWLVIMMRTQYEAAWKETW